MSETCAPWTTPELIEACHEIPESSPDFTASIETASDVLYRLSGLQFPGECERTVRPCGNIACGCWPMSGWTGESAVPIWFETAGVWAAPGWGAWGCSCDRCLSRVELAGYATEISEVTISGEVIDPESGDGWRLDQHHWLTRMDDASGQPRYWPSCQDLDAPDDAPGSFTVTYSYGKAPPQAGIDAATELAYQLWLACNGSDDCALPAGVTRVTRQGVTIERQQLLSFGKGRTGLTAVDVFLGAYNPAGLTMPSVFYSPDVTPPARHYG